jgi:hypothetical protein
MGFFFTQQLLTRLSAGADLNNKSIKVSLFAKAPLLEGNASSAALLAVTTLQNLRDLDGWEEVSAANYVAQALTNPLITSGNNRYLTLNTSFLPSPLTMGATQVEAMVLSVEGTDIGLSAGDKVLFGATTPFSSRKTVFRGGDGISGRLDSGANDAGITGKRWLFGWVMTAGVASSVVDGTTVIQQGAPPFEVSHVHHAWLVPQRVNYIANPSWENGISHWQTNGVLKERVEGTNNFPSRWVGHYKGTSLAPENKVGGTGYNAAGRLYTKSNAFYPRSQSFTFQFMAKGVGLVRVGLAYYPRDYSEYATDWGVFTDGEGVVRYQEWELNSDTYTQLRGVRSMSDGYEAALLIEVQYNGVPEIYIDKALTEEGVLIDWDYFDGDSTYGAPEDYSWYGDVALNLKRGKSFSMWYNNRRSIGGRLFGRRLDDTAYYTSTDEQLDSLVSQWTPAGSVVVPHWDVLEQEDMKALPVDRSVTALPVLTWSERGHPNTSPVAVSIGTASAIGTANNATVTHMP